MTAYDVTRPILFIGRLADISAIPTWFPEDKNPKKGVADVLDDDELTAWVRQFIVSTSSLNNLVHPTLCRFLTGMVAQRHALVVLIDGYAPAYLKTLGTFLLRSALDAKGELVEHLPREQVQVYSSDYTKKGGVSLTEATPITYIHVDTYVEMNNAFLSMIEWAEKRTLQVIDLRDDNFDLKSKLPDIHRFASKMQASVEASNPMELLKRRMQEQQEAEQDPNKKLKIIQ